MFFNCQHHNTIQEIRRHRRKKKGQVTQQRRWCRISDSLLPLHLGKHMLFCYSPFLRAHTPLHTHSFTFRLQVGESPAGPQAAPHLGFDPLAVDGARHALFGHPIGVVGVHLACDEDTKKKSTNAQHFSLRSMAFAQREIRGRKTWRRSTHEGKYEIERNGARVKPWSNRTAYILSAYPHLIAHAGTELFQRLEPLRGVGVLEVAFELLRKGQVQHLAWRPRHKMRKRKEGHGHQIREHTKFEQVQGYIDICMYIRKPTRHPPFGSRTLLV